jgi:hypothetical protein
MWDIDYPKTSFTPFNTLEEVRGYVLDHLRSGARCPCCGQTAKVYGRKYNLSEAYSLIWLVKESGPLMRWVNVPENAPKGLIKSREFPKNRYWGLIEPKPNDDDPKKKDSGIWRPTDKGVNFAYNRIRLEQRVFLYDNHVVGFASETMSILDALGTRFDYEELMSDRSMPDLWKDSKK